MFVIFYFQGTKSTECRCHTAEDDAAAIELMTYSTSLSKLQKSDKL